MKQYYFKIILLLCLFSTPQFINAQGIIKDDFLVNDDSITFANNYATIAMNNSGNFVISWNDNRNGWGNWDVFFQIYNSDGDPVGTNELVNNDGGIQPQIDASVAMSNGGNFVIAWEDERSSIRSIYYQVYDSNGNTIGPNSIANDSNQWELDPSVAIDDTGNFVIVWTDPRNGNKDIYFQRFDSGGNKIGINNKANDTVLTLHEAPSVAMQGNGNFVIVWKDFRNGNFSDIYLQRYDSNGNPLGSNVIVDDDAVNASQYISAIAIDGFGNFVVVWDDERNGNPNIYLQRYDSNGNAIGSNVKVNDDIGNTKHSFPSVAMADNGDFVITWMSSITSANQDVEGQRYFANGSPNGSNYQVVADGPNLFETLPVVAANSSRIAFAWEDNRLSPQTDIYGKLVTWDWSGVTDVEKFENILSDEFFLSQNYPNPFNPTTTIKYQISELSSVTIKVFDVLGNEITTLINEEKLVGTYEVEFNSHSSSVRNLPSGVYFYQLKAVPTGRQAGVFVETKKIILLK